MVYISLHASTGGHKPPIEHALQVIGPSCRRASYTTFVLMWSSHQNKSAPSAICPSADITGLIPLQLTDFTTYVDHFCSIVSLSILDAECKTRRDPYRVTKTTLLFTKTSKLETVFVFIILSVDFFMKTFLYFYVRERK